MFKQAVFCGICSFATLSALQQSALDPLHPIEINFSSDHHNRIIVHGGNIIQMYSTAGNMDVTCDPSSGQIFVRSNGRATKASLLSLVLDTGEVQDLLITFSDKEPEVLAISAQSFCEESTCTLVSETSSSDIRNPEKIADIIFATLHGSVPEGFHSEPHNTFRREIKNGVFLDRTAKLISENEILYLYTVTNERLRTVSISEKELNHDRGIWTFAEKNRIGSKQKTFAIAAVARRGV